jgi:ABC-2 type transport system ATP-binding protein
VIETRKLTKRYGNLIAANQIDLKLDEGDVFGFIGPNGSGKTTTMRMLATLLAPDFGEAYVDGHSIYTHPREIRRIVGFMPDFFGVYDDMKVIEYLEFFAAAYRIDGPARRRVCEEKLELVDMTFKRDAMVNQLSRGQTQRIGLARVLLHEPKVLLLDEPASGLDPRARIELMEILRALQAMGKTIFISSHILAELSELCDSVTIIDAGQIRYSGPINDLLVRKSDQLVFRLKLEPAATDYSDLLAGLPGVLTVDRMEEGEYRVSMEPRPDAAAIVLRAALESGGQVRSFGEDRRHLNEAFMDLTRGGVR